MIIKPEEQYRQLSKHHIELMQVQIAEDRAMVTDDVIKSLESQLDVQGSLHDRFVLGSFYVKSAHNKLIRRGIQMLTDLLQYGGKSVIHQSTTTPRHDHALVQEDEEREEYDDFDANDPNRTVLLGKGASPVSSPSSTSAPKSSPVRPVPSQDPFHTNRMQYKRDCLYFIALGHYHLGDYAEARKKLENLLHVDPRNEQAQKFMMLVDKQIKEQGSRGLAIAAGAATVGAGALVGAAALGAAVLFAVIKR